MPQTHARAPAQTPTTLQEQLTESLKAFDAPTDHLKVTLALALVLSDEQIRLLSQVPDVAGILQKLGRTIQDPADAMLFNEVLLTRRGELNAFTREVKACCLRDGSALVELREGTMVSVKFRPAVPENYVDDAFIFIKGLTHRVWEMDGRSVASRDLDIVHMPLKTPAHDQRSA